MLFTFDVAMMSAVACWGIRVRQNHTLRHDCLENATDGEIYLSGQDMTIWRAARRAMWRWPCPSLPRLYRT